MHLADEPMRDLPPLRCQDAPAPLACITTELLAGPLRALGWLV